jgi:type IV fimbrial biogenesis protein FimT
VKGRSEFGFSALELMIAISLVAILAAVAFPRFASLTAPFRVQSAGHEVYSALQELRQEAIKRGTRTRFQVVGSDSYTLQWEDGASWRTIRGPIRLESGTGLTSTGGDLTYRPNGTVSPLSTLTVSDVTKPERHFDLDVTVTGLVRIQQGSN